MSSAHLAREQVHPAVRTLHRNTRSPSPAKRPLFRLKDFLVLAALGCGGPLFGALPRALCIRLARALAGARASAFAGELKTARLDWLADRDRQEADAIRRRHLEERSVASLLFLRSLIGRPGWEVELQGAEEIDAALGRGKGAVLWVSDLLHARDVAKIALSQAGYRASHLSQPEHGFSDSAFGVHVLNRIRTGFEMRFLRERIVHCRSEPGRTVERLLERLAANGIVSITATAAEGRKVYEAPFLNGRIRLAPGAPKIGYRAGAPVLPVFVVPCPEAPRFRVVVGRPLKMDGNGEAEALTSAAQDYVGRLEAHVRQWPHLWAGWA